MTKPKLTEDEIREKQKAAGEARRGPVKEPKKKDRMSATGYVIPGRTTGVRHLERNREIVRRFKKHETVEHLAEEYGLAAQTIRHILRYGVPAKKKAS